MTFSGPLYVTFRRPLEPGGELFWREPDFKGLSSELRKLVCKERKSDKEEVRIRILILFVLLCFA